MTRLFRVLAKRTFIHEGTESTRWYRIGEMKFTESGGKYLRLYQFPETEYFVVEATEDKEELPTIA